MGSQPRIRKAVMDTGSERTGSSKRPTLDEEAARVLFREAIERKVVLRSPQADEDSAGPVVPVD
jgi:hypothetical protein